MAGWLIDGMNVIGSRPTGWWRDIDAAIEGFVAELRTYARRTGEAVTVVFDHRPEALEPGAREGVEVAFAARSGRDAADHEIIRRLERSPGQHACRVVTSDRALAERARALDAEVLSSGVFRRRLDQVLGGDEPIGPA